MSASENPFGPNGWTPDQLGSLNGKTYVITGANTGIGYEAARVFLSKKATVVMLNRNTQKSASAVAALRDEFGTNAKVSFIHMDLAVLDSVRDAAAEVLTLTARVDALICNAAISQTPTQKITVDGFESQLGVNYFGHFLLCGLLYERVAVSSGRVVVVGSNGYKMGLKKIQFDDLNFDTTYSAWNAYNQSKLAQMIFAYELQRRVEVAGHDVQVQVCHPGMSKTELISGDVTMLNKVLFKLISPLAQSAEKGSWPEVMCATEDGLQSETYYGPTKRSETVGPVGVCPLEDGALDQAVATKLWQVSEEKTGLAWSPNHLEVRHRH